MERLVIIGARQHAKVLVSIVDEFYSESIEIAGYLDDDPELTETKLLGYPVLGQLSDLEEIIVKYGITSGAVGISNRHMKLRDKTFHRLKEAGLKTPSFIHPGSHISSCASVGEGVVINPGVVVNAFARVGDNSVIYSNAAIEHETVLGENVYIGPGVCFSSNAKVGKNTFIGAGARIVPDIIIGSDVIAGAGSVIISNVPDGVTVAGVPAKVINQSAASKI